MKNDKYLPPEPTAFGLASAPPQAAVNYPPPSYSQHAFPPQGPSLQPGYPPPPVQQGYAPQQDFAQPGYTQQVYPTQGYPAQAYPPQSFAPPPQVYVQPAQHYVPPPPPLPTILLVRPLGWYQRTKINRPQMNVLSAATFIFATGGMNIAWSIGFQVNDRLDNHIRAAWFIGAIIGAAIAAFLPRVLPRRVITSSTHNDLSALQAHLYLNGIANGLAFAPTLALAGELAVFYMRGKISASTEQLSFNLGIFLQIIIAATYSQNYNYNNDYHHELVGGIIAAVFGFLGIVFAALMFIESPVTLVASGREQAAVDALRRLQRLFTPHDQTLAQLEEHKRYVADNQNLATEESFSRALPAFFKLAALRCVNAISISSFFCEMLSYSSIYAIEMRIIIFGAARLLGSCIGALVVDSLGRKGPTVVGFAGATAFAFVAASQTVFGYHDVVFWLYFFEFFAGLALTITSAYLSEAYPLNVKQHFISFTFIVEMLIFIIIGSCDLVQEFLYIVGGICAGAFVLGILCLPETRRTTLRVAQQRFTSFVSLCSNS
ncbi:hypothetical protein KR093_007427 [Drosophila rubida]|uniref:Uncharacterized protein n=1 Tax=Drosophila rubida TaxID=30044 RepID=A0AAD4K0N9_9MUSC|nr:hypothetical protein KR093_007427 [Drosophila rubida]